MQPVHKSPACRLFLKLSGSRIPLSSDESYENEAHTYMQNFTNDFKGLKEPSDTSLPTSLHGGFRAVVFWGPRETPLPLQGLLPDISSGPRRPALCCHSTSRRLPARPRPHPVPVVAYGAPSMRPVCPSLLPQHPAQGPPLR